MGGKKWEERNGRKEMVRKEMAGQGISDCYVRH
jgi:hypothetical protein